MVGLFRKPVSMHVFTKCHSLDHWRHQGSMVPFHYWPLPAGSTNWWARLDRVVIVYCGSVQWRVPCVRWTAWGQHALYATSSTVTLLEYHGTILSQRYTMDQFEVIMSRNTACYNEPLLSDSVSVSSSACVQRCLSVHRTNCVYLLACSCRYSLTVVVEPCRLPACD